MRKKTLSDRWKEHYASFVSKDEIDDDDVEELEEFDVEIEEEPEEPQSKKNNVQDLITVRNLLRIGDALEEQHKRAIDIREVDQANYVVRSTSIESYLLRALYATEEGLHINDIIARIEVLGWASTSKYHKYAQVYSALNKNYFMFMRVSKGKFKLREGFRGRKPAKLQQPQPAQNQGQAKLITIKDIVYDISKLYQDDSGIYPSRAHDIMKHIGYSCHYSSVYRAMQTDLFTRDGFWYKPV